MSQDDTKSLSSPEIERAEILSNWLRMMSEDRGVHPADQVRLFEASSLLLRLLGEREEARQAENRWHKAAMDAGVVVCADGSLIFTATRRATQAEASLAEMTAYRDAAIREWNADVQKWRADAASPAEAVGVLEQIADHPGPNADEAAHWRAELAAETITKLKGPAHVAE